MQTRHPAALSLAAFAAAGSLLLSAPAVFGQAEPIASKPVELNIDSGLHANAGSEPRVVWSETIDVGGAGWVRLYFRDIDLDPDMESVESSVIRIMSLEDGGTQHLNAWTLSQWRGSSAYFNGSAVTVDLIARPGSRGNRLVITRLDAGIDDDIMAPQSICGTLDDRTLSTDPRSARAIPIGCSAWIFNDAHHQFITAGHCSTSSLQTIQFNVPLSNNQGQIQHPGPEDQYSVDVSSKQSLSGSIGQDWGYFGVFRNTETGLSAYQAQGEYHILASTPPPVNGQTIRITGYGTTGGGVPREWNQVQKTHTGPFRSFSGTTVRYHVDTTGGNSGSCVLNEDTGEAIGVHTHAGCSSDPNSANNGTGSNHSAWQTALANPRGVCAPFGLTVPPLTAGQPATLEAAGASAGLTVYFIYSLQGQGSTHVRPLGVTLGLASPSLGGSAVADGGGTARLTRVIPSAARGLTITVQAAEAGRTSEIVSRVVE